MDKHRCSFNDNDQTAYAITNNANLMLKQLIYVAKSIQWNAIRKRAVWGQSNPQNHISPATTIPAPARNRIHF
jgi:hypothetical protein